MVTTRISNACYIKEAEKKNKKNKQISNKKVMNMELIWIMELV